MIWLTWRQYRQQAMFTLIGLAVLGAVIIPTGVGMYNAFARLGLPRCVAAIGDGRYMPDHLPDGCQGAMDQFGHTYGPYMMFAAMLVFLPLLVGLFWGAPLVAKEVDEGTHRLVWTQSISRRRWALVKFGLVGAFAVVLSAAYGLGLSWWMWPLTQVGVSRFEFLRFDVQGIVPIGYTLFAIAFGVLAGTLLRKTLPAMGATVAAFVAVRVVSGLFARPHFLPPKVLTTSVNGSTPNFNLTQGTLVLGEDLRDASGRSIDVMTLPDCKPHAKDCDAWAKGAYNWMQYQPADRYWLFQAIETGIFVGLALAMIAYAVRRVRRIS